MFKIDYKNLIIKNKNIITKKDSISVNITSDWAPILEEVSDLIIKKKDKYYGNLFEYFKKGDLNIKNLETVIGYSVYNSVVHLILFLLFFICSKNTMNLLVFKLRHS